MNSRFAESAEIKVPLTPFDRMLRLGAGALFVMIGISTSNWLIAGIGGILSQINFEKKIPSIKSLITISLISIEKLMQGI